MVSPNKSRGNFDGSLRRVEAEIARLKTSKADARKVTAFAKQFEDIKRLVELAGSTPDIETMTQLAKKVNSLSDELVNHRKATFSAISRLQETDQAQQASIDQLQEAPALYYDPNKLKVETEVPEAGVDIRVRDRFEVGIVSGVLCALAYWLIGWNVLSVHSNFRIAPAVVLVGLAGFCVGMAYSQNISAKLHLTIRSRINLGDVIKRPWDNESDITTLSPEAETGNTSEATDRLHVVGEVSA